MQSKTSLFIEMILLRWQSWGAVMQKHALGKEDFFFSWLNTPKKKKGKQASTKENTKRTCLLPFGHRISEHNLVWHGGHLERKEHTPKQDFLDEQGHNIPGTTQTISFIYHNHIHSSTQT